MMMNLGSDRNLYNININFFYRKDVLEQKVKKVLEEIGMTKKIGCKVFVLIGRYSSMIFCIF